MEGQQLLQEGHEAAGAVLVGARQIDILQVQHQAAEKGTGGVSDESDD
jgi:hypothetical protein